MVLEVNETWAFEVIYHFVRKALMSCGTRRYEGLLELGFADQRMGLCGEWTRRVDERGHWRAIAE